MNCHADHLAGGNLAYRCIGGSNYVFSLNLFKNCENASNLPNMLSVKFKSMVGCNTSFTSSLALVDSLDISQICGSQLINSNCNGGTISGTTLYIYEDTVSLATCNDWLVFFEANYRDSGSINISNSDTTPIRIEARINTLDAVCNNSPSLFNTRIPYVCENQAIVFNPGFTEIDGDSLSFSLVSALYGNGAVGTPVVYDVGYSGSSPISGITINSFTGQINFTPTLLGNFTIVIQCAEYRNGIFIGTTQVDFESIVQACAFPSPQADPLGISNFSGNASLTNSNTINMCEGNNFCAEIEFTSAVPSANILLTSNVASVLPGATFIQTGTNPAKGEICWTAQSVLGSIYFDVFAQDDVCPVYGLQSFGFAVNVNEEAHGGIDQLICAGSSVIINANGDNTNIWSMISGEPIAIGTNFSCNPCQNPVISPSISSVYLVEMPSISNACVQKDTIKINVSLAVDTATSAETCLGGDATIDVNVLSGSGNYVYDWGSGVQSEDRINLSNGNYSVLIEDSILGCSKLLNFSISQLSYPNTFAGIDTAVCGLSYALSAIPSFGDSAWLFTSGAIFSDTANPNAMVSVSSYGAYTFYWTENNGNGCNSMDSVKITFIQPPVSNAGVNDSICGLNYNLNALLSTGTGRWNLPSGLGIPLAEINNPNAIVSAASFNTYTLEWIESVGGFCADTSTVQITFLEMPTANSGVDSSVCGLNYGLNALSSFGVGTWHGSSGIVFADSSAQNSGVISSSYGSFDLVWIENNDGCVNSDTTNIIFAKQPTANAGVDDYLCGNQYLLSAAYEVGIGVWASGSPFISFADSSLETTLATLDTSNAPFGIYDLLWIKDNGYGCVDTDTVTIHFIQKPTASAGNDTAICGINLLLDASLNIGSGFWTSNAPFINFDNPINPNALASLDTANAGYGTYQLKWTVDNTINCIDVDSMVVTFIQQPIANAGSDANICGANASLAASSNVGIGTWSSSSPSISFANINDPSSIVTLDSINGMYGSYTLVWTASNGICLDVDTVVYNFIQKTYANAGNSSIVCGISENLQAIFSNGVGTWNSTTPGVLFSNINDPFAMATLDTANFIYGTYLISWSEQNDPSCISSDTIAIVFHEQPNADAGIDIFECDFDAVLNASPSVGSGFWTGDVDVNFANPNNPNTNSFTLLYGSYQLIWIENNLGCLDSDTLQVRFTEQPTANAGADDFICGYQYPLNATYEVGNRMWTSSSPFVYFTNSSLETSLAIIDTANIPYGIYDFIWFKDNGYGCNSSDTISINFVEQPIAQGGSDQFTCGITSVLNAAPAIGAGTWLAPSSFISFSNINDPNSTVTIDTSNIGYGNYPIIWQEDNGFGCVDADTVWINFIKVPTAFAGIDQEVCILQGNTKQTVLQAVPLAATGFWVGSLGTTISNPNSPVTVISATSYGIKQFIWKETNASLCSDADTVLIDFVQQPIANAPSDTAVCGLVCTLSASTSVGTGTWTAQSGVSVDQQNNTTATFTADGYGFFTVYYTIVNGVGCISEDSLKIHFKEIPISNAGLDDEICGFCYTMQAVPSVGIGSWGGPSGITFSSASSPNTFACNDSVYGSKLFIWVENNQGCISAPDFVTINFVPVPTVFAGADTSICGLNYTMQADPVSGTGEWTLPLGTSATDINNETTLITATNYGTYQFIWRALNSLGCDNRDTVAITFLEVPMASAGMDTSLCGSMVQLNSNLNIGVGSWSAVQAGVTFDNPALYNATATANYGNYQLVWTAANAMCLFRDTVGISFIEQPISNAGMNDEICGLTYTLNANQSAGTGQWFGDAGVIFTPNNIPNAIVIVPTTGVYTFYWKENNGAGCIDSAFVSIAFNETPQVQNLVTQCLSQDLYYQITFEVNGGEMNTINTNGISGNFNGNQFTSDSIVNGTGYNFTVSDGNLCGTTNINGSFTCPNNTLSGTMDADTIYSCGNSNILAIHLGDSTLDGNDVFEFVLHNSSADTIGTILAISTNGIFNYNSILNIGQVYYISPVVGNNNGLGLVDTLDPLISIGIGTPVIFYNNPTAILHSDTAVCEGTQVNLVLELTGNSPWQYSYNLNGVPIATENTSDHTDTIIGAEAGMYQVTQLSDQYCNTLATALAQITYIPLPEAEMIGGGNVCEGDSLPIQINVTSNGEWSLYYSIDGVNQDTLNGTSSQYNFHAQMDGVYTINYISDQLCSNYSLSNEILVNVIELPTANAGEDLNLCSGESGQLGEIATSGYNYTWNNSFGLSDGAISNPMINIATSSFLTSNYSLLVTVAGCSSIDQVTVNIHPYPVPIPSSNSITICAGENVQLYAVGGGTYQWQPDSLMDNNNSSSPIAMVNETTNFYVTVNNGFGCITTDTITVNTLPLPNVQFSSNSQFECAPGQISFNNETEQLVSSTLCQWDFDNGTFSNLQFPSPVTYTDTGLFDITLKVRAENGCTNSLTKQDFIKITDTQAAFSFSPTEVDIDFPVIEFQNQSPETNYSIWDFGDNSISYEKNPTHTYDDNNGAKYTACLESYSVDGCMAKVCYEVIVLPRAYMFVPNSFSPNGDGINDVLAPSLVGFSNDKYTLTIFNRRGRIVFETHDLNENWNGTGEDPQYLDESNQYTWRIAAKTNYSVAVMEYTGKFILLR